MDLVVRLVIMRDAFDCVLNSGVPPFGHSTQLRVFVDPDLLQYDEVWAAAGTWNDNFGANPNDIVRVAGGVVTDLKRR
jgi:prolyl-tRNA editing enzyme YbaK/EbsC (Cys-tRNA(Pro) deacylase)